MSLDPLLADLSALLSLPRPRLDEQHACAMRLEGGVRVQLHFTPSAHTLRLLAVIGQASADGRLALLSSLLKGNLQQALDGQPVFGFDRQSETVVLTHALDMAQLSAHALAWQIHHLADLCRGARQALLADRALTA
jgi:hypothetical protein